MFSLAFKSDFCRNKGRLVEAGYKEVEAEVITPTPPIRRLSTTAAELKIKS